MLYSRPDHLMVVLQQVLLDEWPEHVVTGVQPGLQIRMKSRAEVAVEPTRAQTRES